MEITGKVIVVTGAASGIGRGLARRFAAEGASAVVAVDYDGDGATAVAQEIAATGVTSLGLQADVSIEADIVAAIDRTEAEIGPIDLFCSNAGILIIGGEQVPDDDWRRIFDVNVMAHIYAARHLVPRMTERGGGYLLNTCSAAGLLTQIGSAPYSVTKHAALAFAEWLAITHGEQGLKVSALCPQAVESKMTAGFEGGGVAGVDGMLTPEDVAQAVVDGSGRGAVPDPAPPRGGRVLPPQGRRLRALAAGHAPTAGPLRPPDVSASSDSRLAELGIAAGDRVRFRRSSNERWKEAVVVRRERDGGVGLRDPKGAARAIAIELIEVRDRGPRGGVVWEPLTERAARTEQMKLL